MPSDAPGVPGQGLDALPHDGDAAAAADAPVEKKKKSRLSRFWKHFVNLFLVPFVQGAALGLGQYGVKSIMAAKTAPAPAAATAAASATAK